MRSPCWLGVGLLALMAAGGNVDLARGQGVSPPPAMPALPPPAADPAPRDHPLCATDPCPPRGLLQRPSSADACPEPFTPFMLGDFVGPVANLFSDVKIAEGESPRPMSRAFYKFNYYNNLDKDRWRDPAEPIHNVDLYRHIFGFEQAFLDNSVSLGLRVPFYTLDAEGKDVVALPGPGPAVVPGRDGFATTHFGNVSAVIKVLLWEDRASGSLLSGGAIVSFPTASSKKINPGMSTLAFAQPYVGFIVQQGDLFVQGFSSITLSVAGAQSIVLFNDVGVGYYVYRDTSGGSLLKSIAPTLELHVFTPLKQADPNVDVFGIVDDLRLHDIVNVTLGTTFEFSNRSTLGVGAVVPLTGPKPFDVEGLVQLNYRF